MHTRNRAEAVQLQYILYIARQLQGAYHLARARVHIRSSSASQYRSSAALQLLAACRYGCRQADTGTATECLGVDDARLSEKLRPNGIEEESREPRIVPLSRHARYRPPRARPSRPSESGTYLPRTGPPPSARQNTRPRLVSISHANQKVRNCAGGTRRRGASQAQGDTERRKHGNATGAVENNETKCGWLIGGLRAGFSEVSRPRPARTPTHAPRRVWRLATARADAGLGLRIDEKREVKGARTDRRAAGRARGAEVRDTESELAIAPRMEPVGDETPGDSTPRIRKRSIQRTASPTAYDTVSPHLAAVQRASKKAPRKETPRASQRASSREPQRDRALGARRRRRLSWAQACAHGWAAREGRGRQNAGRDWRERIGRDRTRRRLVRASSRGVIAQRRAGVGAWMEAGAWKPRPSQGRGGTHERAHAKAAVAVHPLPERVAVRTQCGRGRGSAPPPRPPLSSSSSSSSSRSRSWSWSWAWASSAPRRHRHAHIQSGVRGVSLSASASMSFWHGMSSRKDVDADTDTYMDVETRGKTQDARHRHRHRQQTCNAQTWAQTSPRFENSGLAEVSRSGCRWRSAAGGSASTASGNATLRIHALRRAEEG
ncbi:hypothetical protein HETIRDRAFT_426881 [Heterobasidion irregulare TC 32-1]|uniref:Uncharacterized protein n=1 Tax=Heterobasidion irregulare (strain TC 32-1) TaxID=747525 RepID=W4K8T4_HETIT|nr:uncharacterized protein HETIRDRAFT_426881 [Heterobasidion irregulare TC 32-1]ETW81476.1 hypothetical protein HETIRDRAFT_426881 [Heterobasidion irregulare TC 32-1]